MANVLVRNIRRPKVQAYLADGSLGDWEDAPYLILDLDHNSDERQLAAHKVNLADHAGLEAEWEAGNQTTLLEAAIDSEAPDAKYPPEVLSIAQRGIAGTYQIEVV